MKEGSRNGTSLRESSMRGTWREGALTCDPKRYAKQSSGNGRQFPLGATLLGNMEGHSFPRFFERRDVSLFKGIYKEFERYVKKAL